MEVEDETQSDGDAAASPEKVVGEHGRPLLPELPDGPDPATRFRRTLNMRAALRSLWESRGITLSLAQRDLRAS